MVPGYGRPHVNIYRPIRTQYGTRFYHRPFGFTPIRYVGYYHAPYRSPFMHSIRYYRSLDWYRFVYRSYPNYIYANWIFYPATGYNNGYYTFDNYPYYVYNGYRYRYSSSDYCTYQLVDSYDHRVDETYRRFTCNRAYDYCSEDRDRLNAQAGENRYFCSETFREEDYDYSTPTYEESNYASEEEDDQNNTCFDTNQNGMCDDFETAENICYDNNNDGYCDQPSTTTSDLLSEAI